MKRQLGLVLVILALTAPTAWAQFCSKCGAATVDDATYCIRCGKALPEETSPRMQPLPPEPLPPRPRPPVVVLPPPRPWEGPATPPPRPRPARAVGKRSIREIRDTYGSLNFFSFSQWRFADDDVKSDFGLTWQYLGLENYLADPSKPNQFWAELGVHSWTDIGTFPNELEIGLVNLNFGLVHFLGNQSTETRLRTAYVLFGIGHYSASTDFPSLGLTVDEDDWGHCWGVGYVTDRLRFEWRRHWVEMSPTVNYDGDQFSIGFRF